MTTLHAAPQSQRTEMKAPASIALDPIRREESVRILFERKYEHLRFLAFKYLHSMEDAHDVVANVFEGALYKWSDDRFREIINLDAFVSRSVINSCLNVLVRRKRFLSTNDIPLDTILVTNPMLKLDLDLGSLLKMLPNKQREAFMLYWDGYSHEEIAQKLNLSTVGASKNLIYNAKKKLQILLSDFDPDDRGPGKSNRKASQKNTLDSNRISAVISGPGDTPRIKDLLNCLNSQNKNISQRTIILKWLANDEFAFEIIAGINRAIRENSVKHIEMRIENDKDKLRKQLFGSLNKETDQNDPPYSLMASPAAFNNLLNLSLFNLNLNGLLISYNTDKKIKRKYLPDYNSNHCQQNAAMEFKKFILDKFHDHIQNSYEQYCVRHGLQKTADQLIAFLIDQDLITTTHLQRYTILREYEQICEPDNCPKTQVVDTLANRTVWSILRVKKREKK